MFYLKIDHLDANGSDGVLGVWDHNLQVPCSLGIFQPGPFRKSAHSVPSSYRLCLWVELRGLYRSTRTRVNPCLDQARSTGASSM
jgi:hypothetical protein